MVWVFAFDRDDTLSCSPKTGPIPLEWVQLLASETPHEVWATGSQRLVEEANIPGTAELIEAYIDRWGDPRDHVHARSHPKVESGDGLPRDAPDPDIVTTVYLAEGNPPARGMTGGDSLTRDQRLRLLRALFPTAEKHIVIDNKYLGHIPGWTHWYPQEFVDFVSLLARLPNVAEPMDVGIPDYYDWPPDATDHE